MQLLTPWIVGRPGVSPSPSASHLHLRTLHPLTASLSASQPCTPCDSPGASSTVSGWCSTHHHGQSKLKMTSRFCRVPSVPSGLSPPTDLMEDLGSYLHHNFQRMCKNSVRTFHDFLWKGFPWKGFPWKASPRNFSLEKIPLKKFPRKTSAENF